MRWLMAVKPWLSRCESAAKQIFLPAAKPWLRKIHGGLAESFSRLAAGG